MLTGLPGGNFCLRKSEAPLQRILGDMGAGAAGIYSTVRLSANSRETTLQEWEWVWASLVRIYGLNRTIFVASIMIG